MALVPLGKEDAHVLNELVGLFKSGKVAPSREYCIPLEVVPILYPRFWSLEDLLGKDSYCCWRLLHSRGGHMYAIGSSSCRLHEAKM